MDYDSSFTRTGLSWPVKSTDGKIWEMGMSEFPLHGTGHPQITMDYNFYAQQEPDTVAGGPAPPLAQSKADSAQVLATYQDMLKAAQTDGVNEPIIIGNHFNDWNNNAYSDAVGELRAVGLRATRRALCTVPRPGRLDERAGSESARGAAEPQVQPGWLPVRQVAEMRRADPVLTGGRGSR